MAAAWVTCRRGHLHRGAAAAKLCEAAWRHALARKDPELQVLARAIAEVLERAGERNRERGL